MKHIKIFEQFINELISTKYRYDSVPDMEELINKAAQAMGVMTDLIHFVQIERKETISSVVESILGTQSYQMDKVMRKRTDDGNTMVYVTYDEDSELYTIFANKNF